MVITVKRRLDKAVNISVYVNISIIISVRNEIEKIKELVDRLNNLIYPKNNFEIIIVDDNSLDSTLEELSKITAGFSNFSIKELSSTGLKGKRNALTFGIQHSRHPYLLITDADCRPQKYWLQAFSEKFESGYDVLFGIAPFYKEKNLVNRISCFENLRTSLLSFSMALLGFPYTATARNFGFTKKTFEAIGGYSNTKDTLSGDDDLLLREAVKRKLKIGVVTAKDSFVYSETKKSFKEYFQQRARHTQTSFHYLKIHQLILGFWHLTNLLILFSPLLMFVNTWFGIFLPAKLLIDFIIIKSTQKEFGYKFSITEIFYLQIFYEIFLIIHFFNARFSEIKWK
jgi:cellulose synthase/poly-beta-1,6-N-acetylglucosamine synthase-like glycosyltransferase